MLLHFNSKYRRFQPYKVINGINYNINNLQIIKFVCEPAAGTNATTPELTSWSCPTKAGVVEVYWSRFSSYFAGFASHIRWQLPRVKISTCISRVINTSYQHQQQAGHTRPRCCEYACNNKKQTTLKIVVTFRTEKSQMLHMVTK